MPPAGVEEAVGAAWRGAGSSDPVAVTTTPAALVPHIVAAALVLGWLKVAPTRGSSGHRRS